MMNAINNANTKIPANGEKNITAINSIINAATNTNTIIAEIIITERIGYNTIRPVMIPIINNKTNVHIS